MGMGRDVGRLGEAELRKWAVQAGLVLNSSNDQDATGWDFLLEWPDNSTVADQNVLLDHKPAPLQCLIQVKSTDRRVNRWSVKLTNWLRFVRTPLPTFFFVFDFGGRDEPQDAFLVHVGETHIRGTLKKLRELSCTSPSPKLHRHTRDLTWTEADRLKERNGKGLEWMIRQSVVAGVEAYAAWKMFVGRTAGYEEGIREMKARFRVPSEQVRTAQELLEDLALGLIPHLELEGGEITDVRFGIPAPEPEVRLPAGTTLTVTDVSPFGKVEVRFRALGIRRDLRIVGDGYLPSGMGTGCRPRMRFRAPFIDWVFEFHGEQRFDCAPRVPDVGESALLTALRPIASFILLLAAAYEAREQIEFEVSVEQGLLGNGLITSVPMPTQALITWATLVEHTWLVARKFEVEHELRVNVAELAAHQGALNFIGSMLDPDPPHIRGTFWGEGPFEGSDEKCCFPLAAELPLDGFFVQMAAAALSRVTPTGEIDGARREFSFDTKDVRCHQLRIYNAAEGRPNQEELIQSVTELYEDSMDVLDLFGCRDGED